MFLLGHIYLIVGSDKKLLSRVTFLRVYYGYGAETNRGLIMEADINNHYVFATSVVVDHESRK